MENKEINELFDSLSQIIAKNKSLDLKADAYNLELDKFLLYNEEKIKVLSDISDLNERFEEIKKCFINLNYLINTTIIIVSDEYRYKAINLLINFCLDYDIKFLEIETNAERFYYNPFISNKNAIFYYRIDNKRNQLIKVKIFNEDKFIKFLELLSEKIKDEETIRNIFKAII